MRRRNPLLPLAAAAATLVVAPIACSEGADETATAAPPDRALACTIEAAGQPLPSAVPETSGIARGRARPELFWTHNDSGGQPEVYAIGADGRLAQVVRLAGASAIDWEDIAVGSCAEGDCLYIGDIGDNDGRRESIALYRVPEPAEGAESAEATPIRLRYPDRPRDAEALFAHGGALYLVSKGRQESIRLFRVPDGAGAGEAATLELVAELLPPPEDGRDRVTAAAASPDGEWVAVRTYRTLLVYPAAALVGGAAPEPRRFDLAPLLEPQGEGVAIGSVGQVWLTSEAPGGGPPTWSRLSCAL